jgi:hypothetical protein
MPFDGYFVFIDLLPQANWSHPARVLLVRANGEQTLARRALSALSWFLSEFLPLGAPLSSFLTPFSPERLDRQSLDRPAGTVA